MRVVDQAVTRPFRCAVVPFVGNGSGSVFVDTGQDLDLEHVYVSDPGLEELVQTRFGVSLQSLLSEPARLRAEVADLEQRLAQSEAERALLQEFKDSVGILAPHGYGAKKLPGRKPNKEASRA